MVGENIRQSKVITSSFECHFENLSLSKSIAEIGKRPLGKILDYLKILKSVFLNLKNIQPDLFYMTPNSKGIGFYKDIPLVLLAKFFGVKRAYHFHNKGVKERQNFWLDRLLYKWVFRKSEVILLSPLLYEDIKEFVPAESVHYCPNGVADSSNKNQTNASALEIKSNLDAEISDSGIVQLLFLSNLMESKGLLILLEVCRLLKEKRLPFKCTIVGGEGDFTTDQLQNRIKTMGLVDCVKHEGKKYDAEKNALFKTADIFVHPSLNDCVPLVILEAMQHGLPVVSTIEGGIPDLVDNGQTGFLVLKQDVSVLAEKLEVLINSPELRQKMGAAGRRKYEDSFTLNHFENRLTEILKGILSEVD